MPTVPDYTPHATTQGPPGVRVSVDQPSEAFGGPLAEPGVARAAGGFFGEAASVFEKEKQKADQVQELEANRQLSDLSTKIQVDTRQMRGKDALNAPGYAQDNWSQAVKDLQENAPNDSQRIAINRLATSHWDSLNKTIQMHVGDQMQKFDESETQGLIDSSRNAAGLNADDDERVAKEVQTQKDAVTQWAARNGIPTDSPQFQDRLTKTLSLTHHDVIQTRLNAGDDQGGEAYFKAHKGEMDAADIFRAEKAIDDATALRRGNELWSQVQGMKLGDGMPDERRMESYVNSQDLSEKDKNRAWEYVKARAGEAVTQKNKEDTARERTFLNNVYNLRKQGASMDDAIKTISNFSVDPTEVATMQQAVQKIYAPSNQKSDPQTYMDFWERIQNGDKSVTKASLGAAMAKDKLSVEQWEQLGKDLYKSNQEGIDPMAKIQWDRVKAFADEKFQSQKVERENFLYVMRASIQDKDPGEYMKIANDKIKEAEGSGYFGSNWGREKTYKLDVKNSDAQSEATSKLYEEMGRTEAQALLEGFSRKGKSWTAKGIDDFRNAFGGSFKPGTPVHNAIRSLIKHKEMVTPDNLNTVLKTYPGGVY